MIYLKDYKLFIESNEISSKQRELEIQNIKDLEEDLKDYNSKKSSIDNLYRRAAQNNIELNGDELDKIIKTKDNTTNSLRNNPFLLMYSRIKSFEKSIKDKEDNIKDLKIELNDISPELESDERSKIQKEIQDKLSAATNSIKEIEKKIKETEDELKEKEKEIIEKIKNFEVS